MKKLTLLVWITFASKVILAQDATTDTVAAANPSTAEEEGSGLTDYLPPLQILIDSAIANSPEVEILDYELKAREYQIGAIRKDWTDLVFINGQYRYTDYSRLVFDEFGDPQPQQALGYQVAAGVRVPLSYFIGRREMVRSAQMDVKSAEANKKKQENEVRERVIETYNHLLLLQRLIKISADAKESTDLMLEMAEDRFRDGEISLDELGQSTSRKAQFSAQYEQLKADFSTTYAMLERLVGVPISKLQNLNE